MKTKRFRDPSKRRKQYLRKRDYWLELSRKWNKEHRDNCHIIAKRYRSAHPERVQARMKKWRLNNKPKWKVHNKKWRKANPDKIKGYRRNWELKYPEKVRAKSTKWRRANPDKHAASKKKWRLANLSRYVQYYHQRKAKKLCRPFEDCSNKIRLLRRISKFCHWCCQKLDASNFTIDHIVPLARGGHHINDNLVPACKKCNFSKGDKLIGEWEYEPV